VVRVGLATCSRRCPSRRFRELANATRNGPVIHCIPLSEPLASSAARGPTIRLRGRGRRALRPTSPPPGRPSAARWRCGPEHGSTARRSEQSRYTTCKSTRPSASRFADGRSSSPTVPAASDLGAATRRHADSCRRSRAELSRGGEHDPTRVRRPALWHGGSGQNQFRSWTASLRHNAFLVQIQGADRELVLRAAREQRPIPAGVR
jgi:hypothetical protein